jgi:putative beta-barrel porin BBP2
MKKVQRLVLLFSMLATSSMALGFSAVDDLPWPSRGEFPAYPADTVGPTEIWAQAGILRDNNILRRETNTVGDTVTRVGVGFRHDQRIVGRQRLIMDARGDYYYFDRFDAINHFAYALLGTWLWELGNDFSGSVVLGRDRRQVDFAETTALRTVRDPVETTRIGATGAYAISPNLRAHAGVAGARAERNSTPDAETRAASYNVGIDYVTPLRNTVGVEFRNTSTDAPVAEFITGSGIFVNNDYHEREIALVTVYAPIPSIRAVGRIGRTHREYTDLPDRDFDGTTYRAGLDWLPGTKTVLGFEAYKAPQSVIDVGVGHMIVKGVAFGPRWAATNKLVLSARFSRERRTFAGDPNVALGGPLRDELATLIRLGVGWEPQRHWQLSFAIDRGERESNFAGRDYQYTAVMANAAWHW